MPKLKRDVQPLLLRATGSLTLAIELFNRPHEVGRSHSVPMLLHHAFEMLLKATILQRGKLIHDKTSRYTIGFDRCVGIVANELRMLGKDEVTTLSIIDSHRDTAAHFYAELSEDMLYVVAQAGVTLFDHLVQRAFGKPLAAYLPTRVLPVSARPPRDIVLLLGSELEEVDVLLGEGRRRGAQAAAKLRSVLAFAVAVRGEEGRVAERQLSKVLRDRRRGQEWTVLLPEVGQLRLQTEGDGVPLTMRITKQGKIPVRIALPGEEAQGTVLKQEVNLFDKYNLNRDQLAEKLKLSGPRTSALVLELGLLDDPTCYRLLRIGGSEFKRYSPQCLERLRAALAGGIEMEAVWRRHGARFTAPRVAAAPGSVPASSSWPAVDPAVVDAAGLPRISERAQPAGARRLRMPPKAALRGARRGGAQRQMGTAAMTHCVLSEWPRPRR